MVNNIKSFFQYLSEETSDAPDGLIFDGPKKAYVGVQHLKRIRISPDLEARVKELVDKYGVWYEGAGKDIDRNKSLFGNKSNYSGCWDDEVAKSIKGYPYYFLVVYFANVKENKTVDTFLDPKISIFDSLIKHQNKKSYFKDGRKFGYLTLTTFLKNGSEKGINFLELSKMPADRENLTKFFGEGEKLTWPDNWLEYPNKLGKMAKKMEDVRNQFILDQPNGVYIAGSGHLKELIKLKSSLSLIGGERI